MLSKGHIQRCHMTVYSGICTIVFNDAVVAVAAAASAAGILPIVMGAGIADINYSTTSRRNNGCTANAAACNINPAMCAVPTWAITTGDIIESRNWPCKLRFIIWSSSGCNGRCSFWGGSGFRSSGTSSVVVVVVVSSTTGSVSIASVVSVVVVVSSQ